MGLSVPWNDDSARDECRELKALKVLDGPELDGPEFFFKKLPKSINEIWTVLKLINKLPKSTPKIRIAPFRSASDIEIVIFG